MRVTDDFYHRLQGVLTERGLSQSDLAKRLRTHPSTLTRWRQGAQPQTNMLILLGEVLGIPIEWLARGTGPQKMPGAAHQTPGFPQKMTGKGPADFEQGGTHNRLNDMSYSNTLREELPAQPAAVMQDILEALAVPELLDLAGRLSHKPEALQRVLDAVRIKTGPPAPVNYLTPTKTKP